MPRDTREREKMPDKDTCKRSRLRNLCSKDKEAREEEEEDEEAGEQKEVKDRSHNKYRGENCQQKSPLLVSAFFFPSS